MSKEKRYNMSDMVSFWCDVIAAVSALILVISGIIKKEKPWFWLSVGVFNAVSAVFAYRALKEPDDAD